MTAAERGDLVASVSAQLARHCGPEVVAAAEGGWSEPVWARLAEGGFTSIGVAESSGGSGGGLAHACAVVREAARHAAPVPLAETLLLAAPILAATGVPATLAPVTVALPGDGEVSLERAAHGWSLTGVAHRVPWARVCPQVLVPVRTTSGALVVATVDPDRTDLRPGRNMAGEPRDELRLTGVAVDDSELRELSGLDEEELWRRGALSRVVLTAGALERTLDLTCGYVREREQFGRPIATFQAVKHLLAQLAAEVGAGVAAAEGAIAGAESARGPFVIAAAKVRSARAATLAAGLAHQLHGALGTTREHPLHHYTRRLWSWRDEYGAQGEWERRLGRMVLQHGGDAAWPMIVGL